LIQTANGVWRKMGVAFRTINYSVKSFAREI